MRVYNDTSIPINLIRQWSFCPRVVYYQEILKLNVHTPLWVSQGTDKHTKINKLEKRRNFSKYHLDSAIRHFELPMKSYEYSIHGIADWVLETPTEVFVVEYKSNPKPNSLGHKLQLGAYSVLASLHFNKPCTKSFLVSDKKSFEIEITETLISKLKTAISDINKTLGSAKKPHSSAGEHQCSQCEYLNFCNDRL